ncbi:adenosylmethionine--8-amino-7-oxononanoate transaminase [Pontibacter sp. BT310]|uniref:Adenosylmethionine-8-amino-7-oxononanoate aminotransferase n=1 Tax=Pontibacter populi TaxID=890055 RepID=A0ABS6XBQ4_9BACT|nr:MULTISPECIES: adenosylmethionine--8-amino-7-oxononanoate transaminase [Pontibacter]MBJ6118588.1 adenosylmethionine--8-amino-7-oxononanoate transaminase [Pontibacter sp. BT310]MBR0571017.1 adenosylmethionine--8-amino-7-oxononanoate transaminase [Microvirga sp. STS03]MBW3365442.1 adenosylmethionine--8-amino-7-oxononanoate transaminase [Pontibacter populi]
MSLAERDQQIIWHPYTQMKTAALPIAIVRGEGALLYAEDGKEYIDAVASWWVNLHGHAHPHIAKKVSEQLQTLEHVIFAGFTHQPAVALAEGLLKILPQGQSKVFYSDNGSTAVEVALKMAIQYWANLGTPKKKIIAFRDSYHGDTFGAMAVSSRSAFTAPFWSYLFEVDFIDVPVAGNEAETIAQLEALAIAGNVAAFIYEPLVLGTAGMIMYEPEVLDKLIDICQQHNILTIADEVMTGFGRTGKLFASHYLQNKPDMVCLSKGLTGGTMALGVTTCNTRIYDAFLADDKGKTLFHGHSYTANPVACAAGIASLELTISPETQQNLDRISNSHQAFADELKPLQGIKEVRQRGTILAIEFADESTSYFSNLRDVFYNYALEQGVILRPLGNIIYIIPPYCITDAQLHKVYQTIKGMQALLVNR